MNLFWFVLGLLICYGSYRMDKYRYAEFPRTWLHPFSFGDRHGWSVAIDPGLLCILRSRKEVFEDPGEIWNGDDRRGCRTGNIE